MHCTRAGVVVLAIALIGGRAQAQGQPWLAAKDVAAAVVTALGKPDPAARAGETRRLAWIRQPTDAGKEVGELRTQLGAAGLTVIDEETGADQIRITLEAASGARAMVTLGRHGGGVFVVPRPTAARAPGKCVPIPQRRHDVDVRSRGIDQRGEQRTGEIWWSLSTARLLDVDGDAVLDAFVPRHTGRQCPEAAGYDVYLVRGTCGHALGSVGPGSPAQDAQLAPLDGSGFRPIAVESRTNRIGPRGIPESTTLTTRFVVKRGAYVEVGKSRNSGICHHCATWYCVPH